jgi:putative membrane protein
MIVRPHPTCFACFYSPRLHYRGNLSRAANHFLRGVPGCSLQAVHPAWLAGLSIAPFTPLGLALSIFLGFRNNVCYQRWWEARSQWGQLLMAIRSFMRDLSALLPDDKAACRRQGQRLIAFGHSLRGDGRETIAAWLGVGEWAAVRSVSGTCSLIITL